MKRKILISLLLSASSAIASGASGKNVKDLIAQFSSKPNTAAAAPQASTQPLAAPIQAPKQQQPVEKDVKVEKDLKQAQAMGSLLGKKLSFDQEIALGKTNKFPGFFTGVGVVSDLGLEGVISDSQNQSKRSLYFDPSDKLQKMLAHVEKGLTECKTDAAQFLLKELNFYKGQNQISLAYLNGVAFRYALSQKVNQDELMLIRQTPFPNFLDNMLKLNWRHPISASAFDYDERLFQSRRFMLTEDQQKQIDAVLEKGFSKEVFVPIWGQGKFGVATILRAWFSEVFLGGLPTKPLKAHGVETSPLGFISHDFLHSELDRADVALEDVVYTAAYPYLSSGGKMKTFTDHYLPYMIQKSSWMKNSLEKAYAQMLTDMASQDQKKVDLAKQAMVGLFFLVHEQTLQNNKIFTANTLSGAFKASIDFSKQGIAEDQWQSTDNLLQTNLQGQTTLTDDQICDLMIKKYTWADDDRHVKGSYVVSDKIDEKQIQEKRVDRHHLFHTVYLTMHDGKVFQKSFPTAKFVLGNAHDTNGLLKLAGMGIKKDAQNFVAQVNQNLVRLMDSTHQYLNQTSQSLGLEAQFTRWHDAQLANKELKAILDVVEKSMKAENTAATSAASK